MPTDGKLTEYDYLAVAYVEEYFWTNHKAPFLSQISEHLGRTVEELNNLFLHPAAQEYFLTRGITNPSEDLVEAKGLTPHQLYVANVLLNQHDRRSLREKLKDAKITSQKFNAWVNDEKFAKYLQKRIEYTFNTSDWQVKQSLLNNASDGDTAAQKLYFQLTGQLVERHEHTINIEGTLSQVAEIVGRYIKDPQIMLAIAEDFEYLLQTGQAPVDPVQILELSPANAREA